MSVFVSLSLLSSLSFMTGPFSFSNPPPERQAWGVGDWGRWGVGERQNGEVVVGGSFEGEREELKMAGVVKEAR